MNHTRTAFEEFMAWLLGGALVSLLLSAPAYIILNLGTLTCTYLVALGVAALITFVGIVIIKVSDDGDVNIL